MSQVLEFERAIAVVLEQASSASADKSAWPRAKVDLLEAAGRVLADEVCADRDQPPVDRATRDGFAVRAADGNGQRRILGQVRAGQVWGGQAASTGEAIQIMTGSPMPAGTDAVVMVEHVEVAGPTLSLSPTQALEAGDNVVAQGAEALAGELVVPAGACIGAAEIALSAACGKAHLEVFEQPRVAIVATGDELVELDQAPTLEQIRNSNSYAIAAMVRASGGVPVRLAIAADTLDSIRDRMEQARSSSSLLVLSGGVSMGEYDLVEQVLAEAGAEFFFTGVRMQPGKPVVFGRLPPAVGHPACYFFGLPGNPVSTQVTFLCFVRPLLEALAGGAVEGPQFTLATLGHAQAPRAGVTRLLPGRRTGTEVSVVGWQGSGDQAANARADCYVELKAGVEYVAGAIVRTLLR